MATQAGVILGTAAYMSPEQAKGAPADQRSDILSFGTVVPFPAGSGKWQISTGGGFWPRWRRDGKEVFFVGPEREMMAAGITASGATFEAAPPVPLFETLIVGAFAGGKPQYAVSADGRFLITVPAEDATPASRTLLQAAVGAAC